MLRKPFLILILLTVPALAQLGGLGGGVGGGLGGIGNGVGGVVGRLPGTIGNTAGRFGDDLRGVTDVARDLVGRPLTAVRQLARDGQGFPILKGEVLAVGLTDIGLAASRRLGFSILRQDRLEALGLSSTTLIAPDGMDTEAALSAMRQADPAGIYDFAHVYNPSGEERADLRVHRLTLCHPMSELA